MSKYYNPRNRMANTAGNSKPKPPKSTNTNPSKAKGGGPSKADIAKSNQNKNKSKNTNPSKAKGGSKADIAKKNQQKNKSTQQGKNVSAPKNKAPQFDSAKGGGKMVLKFLNLNLLSSILKKVVKKEALQKRCLLTKPLKKLEKKKVKMLLLLTKVNLIVQ